MESEWLQANQATLLENMVKDLSSQLDRNVSEVTESEEFKKLYYGETVRSSESRSNVGLSVWLRRFAL